MDLSDPSYHLSEISLAPARLNIVLDTARSSYGTNTYDVPAGTTQYKVGDTYNNERITSIGTETVNTEGSTTTYRYAGLETEVLTKAVYMLGGSGAYLQTPVYGTDGRLDSLTTDGVVNGPYNSEANGFADDDSAFGVRAVGTTSNMTPAQMALRTAKQAVSSAISTSKSNATTSLRQDAVKLASILVSIQTESADDPSAYAFDDTEKAEIKATIDNLTAVALNLEHALKQAVYAVGVAQGVPNWTLDQIVIGSGQITAPGVVWDNYKALEATIKEAGKTLADMKATLSSADEAMDSNVYKALGALLNADDFEIIDSATGKVYTVAQMVEMIDDSTKILTAAKILMANPTISIKGGVYHDIALFSGNFSGAASLAVDVTHSSGISISKEDPVDVIMATNAAEPTITYDTDNKTVTGYYLNVVLAQLSNVTASGTGEDTYLTITDIYGYAIDLAFRTNATGSSLLLQTEAANRVEDSTETQGAGSFMQFTSANDDFTLLQVINLMNSVRVVFLGDDNQVFGVAAMKVTAAPVMSGEEHVDYATGTAGHDLDVNGKAYTLTGAKAVEVGDETYIKAELNLYGFSIDSNGVMSLGSKLASNTLTELQQNTALGVTSLVYLDGDEVENADVAISGNSITGTMNLQFASDAELDPMDYTFNTKETLGKPTVSYSGDKLTITAATDAPTGVKYDIYTKIGNTEVVIADSVDAVTDYTVSLPSEYAAVPGTYKIYVRAVHADYNASEGVLVTTITIPTT